MTPNPRQSRPSRGIVWGAIVAVRGRIRAAARVKSELAPVAYYGGLFMLAPHNNQGFLPPPVRDRSMASSGSRSISHRRPIRIAGISPARAAFRVALGLMPSRLAASATMSVSAKPSRLSRVGTLDADSAPLRPFCTL